MVLFVTPKALLAGNNERKSSVITAIVTVLTLFATSFAVSDAFGQEQVSEFTVIEGEEIKSNPVAQQILQKIEESKRIMAEMLAGKPVLTEQQKLVEEQRRIVKERLEADLKRMDKDYESYTPRNSFAKFVSSVDPNFHDLYWDQFNYMDEKIKIARIAKQLALADSATYEEAQAEYIKYASLTRVEMVKLVQDLNVKHGFADQRMQNIFDEYGKLVRYENDKDEAVCYGCEYVDADALLAKANPDSAESTITFVSAEIKKNADVKIESPRDATVKRLEDKLDSLSEQLASDSDPKAQQELVKSIERIVSLLDRLKKLE
ncbi:MAG: hypothetical protein HYS75_01475 [Nitrosopumilales archaeon]|nr:hypothetical protein [Nitrosopumilales archaeon]